ncbi:MAG: DUF1592 domain-containing protein, partial [Planctomycetota bacterium]
MLAHIFLLGVACGVGVASEAEDDPFVREMLPFFAKYCTDCHSEDYAESGVDLSIVTTLPEAQKHPARWNQVRGMIELGAMPPADHDPLPTADERLAMARRLDELVNRVDCGTNPGPGRVTMRRLNRVEYDNTIRDLLHVEFKPSEIVGLPSDDVGNGFDNQGEVLGVSPLLMEKYLNAAAAITERAIVFDRQPLRDQRVGGESLKIGAQVTQKFWMADGEYELFFRADFGKEHVREKAEVEFLVDGKVVGTTLVGRKLREHTMTFQSEAGRRTVGMRFSLDPLGPKPEDWRHWVWIDYFGIRGPKNGLPAYPASHSKLIIATPGDGLSTREAATRVFENFLPRAYRRAVEPIEVQRLVDLVVATVEQGESYERGIALGVQAALASPHFLFRVETTGVADPSIASIDSSGIESVGNYELASRLSYFLGATMPDDELLRAAGDGRLADEKELQQQVARLLAKPDADTLVTRFVAQWLGLTALEQLSPSPEEFPLWNTKLASALQEETFRLCRWVLEEDRSLLDLFDADFTFINPRLAELYGVEFNGQDPHQLFVEGPGQPTNRERRARRPTRGADYQHENEWIRVPAMPGRRGVMTHGSVLAI